MKNKKPDVVDDFAAIALEDQLRHQLLFGKFERKAPKEQRNDVNLIRTETLKQLSQALKELDAEAIEGAVSSAMNKSGSPFKALRNAALLEALQKNAPSEVKDILAQEEQETTAYFKSSFTQLQKEQRKMFPEYIKEIGEEDAAFGEILKDIAPDELTPQNTSLPPNLQIPEFSTYQEYVDWLNKFLESDEYKQLLKQVEQFSEPIPSSDDVSPDTSYPTPQSEDTCPYIDDPVCGNDGYTYNNECEAKQYSVEVVHKGECEQDYQEDQ